MTPPIESNHRPADVRASPAAAPSGAEAALRSGAEADRGPIARSTLEAASLRSAIASSARVRPNRGLAIALGALLASSAARAQSSVEVQPPPSAYQDCGLEPPGTEWGGAPAPKPNELPFVAPGEPPLVTRVSTPRSQLLHFGSASPKLRGGALSGKSVYVSAGHGYYGPSPWTTQRGVTHNIVEDIVSTETISQFLVPMLLNAGAYVVTARELDMNAGMDVVDNADADYSETGPAGTFSTSGSAVPGYGAPPTPIPSGTNVFTLGTNRLMEANVGSTSTASAQFVFNVPADGDYDVYLAYSQFSYRVPDAHFVVKHAGGESHFRINQRRHGGTWVFLGRFYFRKGKDAAKGAVVAFNDSSVTGNVSLDAVRIGGGTGLVAASTDGSTSGRPRFEECARYSIQYQGAPTTVYDNPNLADRDDDVSARSKFTAWQHETGEDAVYVAWHTNAFDGSVSGTETYVYGTNPPDGSYAFSGVAGSDVLAQKVHGELVKDLQNGWSAAWKDRKIRSAYFGEINPNNNPETPAILCEVAYHDNASDSTQLKEAMFRYTAARAIAQGIIKYFAAKDGVTLTLPPEPPVGAFARNLSGSAVQIGWSAAPVDAKDLGGDAATGFRLYSSDDGLAWDDGQDVSGTSTTVTLAPGMVKYFRVSATNAGGESFPSEVVAVGVPDAGIPAAPVLVVNGFDRLDATIARSEALPNVGTALRVFVERMNDGTYARRHGLAIAQNGYGFDTATMAAVGSGAVNLAGYAAVDWFAGRGEQGGGGVSAATETALRTYVEGGGRLIFSGSNVATALGMGGAADAAFLAEVLHASVNTGGMSALSVNGSTGQTLDGITGVVLDDGLKGAYPAGTMDALGAAPGAMTIAEFGGTNGGAAVLAPAPSAVAYLGFPFETVVSEQSRKDIMGRLLTALAVPKQGMVVDGGTVETDAGMNPADAGQGGDVDAGASGDDAGTAAEPVSIPVLGGEYPNAKAGGCGCGAGSSGSAAFGAFGVWVAVVLTGARRRRTGGFRR